MPSLNVLVAVTLKARNNRWTAMPATSTAKSDVALTATSDMTALLICIQGTRMSKQELISESFFLLPSTHLATTALQHDHFLNVAMFCCQQNFHVHHAVRLSQQFLFCELVNRVTEQHLQQVRRDSCVCTR